MTLTQRIQDLSVFLYTELHSDQQKLSNILSLSPKDALGFIKGCASDLLAIRQRFLRTDEFEDFESGQQYQRALQKLEGEVRNHIRIQQQMKILIDSQEESERENRGRAARLQRQVEEGAKANRALALRVAELESSNRTLEGLRKKGKPRKAAKENLPDQLERLRLQPRATERRLIKTPLSAREQKGVASSKSLRKPEEPKPFAFQGVHKK